jgi:hypothetical protein
MARAWLKVSVEKRAELEPLSFEAEYVWFAVGLWCAAIGNDGTFPKAQLHVAVARKFSMARATKYAAELVTAGLWVEADGNYAVTGWLDDQPATAVWNDATQRERWQRNKALSRDRALCRRVQERDRHLCRYCGERVNWGDRKGPLGGTYDHVDPDGPNSLDNVVVACRKCNGRKRDRTPAQAGMTLITLLDIVRLARELEQEVDPAEIQPGSSRNLAGAEPGSDRRSDSLTCAREAGPGQTGAEPGPDRSGTGDPPRVTGDETEHGATPGVER